MSGPNPLADQADRIAITDRIDQSLFVEAGAGTGKTHSLVSRIVHLVEVGGVDIARIAAITFTEAAARELRSRVRLALQERAEEVGRESLWRAASGVDAAAFTTLHGFALRLLSDHPVEAGLPPGFSVVDEMTSLIDFYDQWELFFGRMGDNMVLFDFQERAAALGVKLSLFDRIAQQLEDNWDLLQNDYARPASIAPELVKIDNTAILGSLRELALAATTCLDPSDKLCQGLERLGREVEAVAAAGDLLDQLQGLDQLSFPPGRSGRKDLWPPEPGVQAIRDDVKATKAQVTAHVARYRDDVLRAMAAMVIHFVLERVDWRRNRGELSFHDLLVFARQLLRNEEEVRRKLHDRYPYLLLDEFQDTDPIQIELAVLLASETAGEGRSWGELASELQPGRLVVVGDPKQSIYRFRRADMGVYSRTESMLKAQPVRLSTNFRSVPGVVEWVNQTFQAAMGDGEPNVQPAYRQLIAHRPADPPRPEGAPPVVMLGGPLAESVGQIRQIEARDVAAVVCRAMAEEWPVRDGTNGWRKPTLSDIAVLIPSRLSLPALEAAFANVNVPFRPETSSLVYSTQEVREVLAAVRAVVDPTSAIDVVASLRSGLFACSDEDLLDWFNGVGANGPPWDYRNPPPEAVAANETVAEAFAVLNRWHEHSWWTDPAAMVNRVVGERRLREVALADRRPRDRWRRYRFLAEQARAFNESHGGDLHDFVRWAELQSSELARITEPVSADPDDDAVRVLTVHGSKGLEFPIAILAGAPTIERSGARGPQVLFPPGSRPEVRTGSGAETAGYDATASVEELLDKHERVRLHYVAATRAEDHLIVSAYHKVAKSAASTSMGRRTWDACQADPGLWQSFEATGEEFFEVEPLTQLRLPSADFAAASARWRASRQATLDLADAAAQLSPTLLGELVGGHRPLTTEDFGEGAIGYDSGQHPAGTGPLLGIAVHEVLELIDFDHPEAVETLAVAAAQRIGQPELCGVIADRVTGALETETLQAAREYKHWRELYVSFPTARGGVEGFIDLCIQSPEGLVVVDYKTDRIDVSNTETAERDLAARLDRYEVQLATYALALQRLTGEPVVDCRLLFLTEAQTFERSLPDLGRAIERVEELLASGDVVSGS